MCELLGINVDPPTRAGVFFKAFTPRAEHNPSGWGIGWFDESDQARLVKEPLRADVSELAAELASDPPRSSTFIVHVRAATVGELSLENTHPFTATMDGATWIFAHNGTIQDPHLLDRGDFVAQGQTDSEAAFHFLLARIAAKSPDQALEDAIYSAALELTDRGKANFLLTDGTTLFAYYDGHKTLHYKQVQHLDGEVRVADDADYTIDIDASHPDDHMVVIASVPLDDGPWTAMRPGEMVVCSGGTIRTIAAAESPRS